MSRDGSDLVAFDRKLDVSGPFAGVDEAGRGCLAGPVVAAAVVLHAETSIVGLDDSKRLTPGRREELYREIVSGAPFWSARCVSSRRIDRINILRATLEAMGDAVRSLGVTPALVLVDGVHLPELPCPGRALVGGDGRSACIAAASIVAKVVRDALMVELDGRWPGYGFADNKGYGAPAHLSALKSLGPTPVHRHSFRPVAATAQGSIW